MNILALDTSTEYMTVAVIRDRKTIGKFHKKVGRNHSTLLVPTIDKLLKKCRMKSDDMDCIAVGVGPGSFTGLRIGITTVKALAYVLKTPIIAVPTFDAIANNGLKHRGTICVVLDARKNKVYASIYKSDGKAVKKLSKYLLLPVQELEKKLTMYDNVIFLGDGASIMGKVSGVKAWHPRADRIGTIGAEKFKKREFVKPEDLEPMYIYSRECDIKGR